MNDDDENECSATAAWLGALLALALSLAWAVWIICEAIDIVLS